MMRLDVLSTKKGMNVTDCTGRSFLNISTYIHFFEGEKEYILDIEKCDFVNLDICLSVMVLSNCNLSSCKPFIYNGALYIPKKFVGYSERDLGSHIGLMGMKYTKKEISIDTMSFKKSGGKVYRDAVLKLVMCHYYYK